MRRQRYDSDDDEKEDDAASTSQRPSQPRPQSPSHHKEEEEEELPQSSTKRSVGDPPPRGDSLIDLRKLEAWDKVEAIEPVKPLETVRDEDRRWVMRSPPRHLLSPSKMLAFCRGRDAVKQFRWTNRFGLNPGWQWDGVDRTNGFERRILERTLSSSSS